MQAAAVTAVLGLIAALAGCQSQNDAALSSVDRSVVRHHAMTADVAGDELLAARLVTALEHDPITRASEIEVSVAQGRARLHGFVEGAAIKLRAGVLAAQTDGIEVVDNRLILRDRVGVRGSPIGEARVHL